jgi:hypothetical protein
MDAAKAKGEELQKMIGLVLGSIAVLVPGTLEWQIPGKLSAVTLLIVAAVGGAVAGRILVPLHERLLAGVVAMAGGALAAIGAFALLRWWVAGRDSVHFIECMVAIFLGALPGGLLGRFLYARLR